VAIGNGCDAAASQGGITLNGKVRLQHPRYRWQDRRERRCARPLTCRSARPATDATPAPRLNTHPKGSFENRSRLPNACQGVEGGV
jgi:hypothetical protein